MCECCVYIIEKKNIDAAATLRHPKGKPETDLIKSKRGKERIRGTHTHAHLSLYTLELQRFETVRLPAPITSSR